MNLFTVPQVFDKEFEKDIAGMTNKMLVDELKRLKRSIHETKTECEPYLKEIRNVLAGHKDHNTFKQLEVLEKLDVNKMEMIAMAAYLLFVMANKFEKNVRACIKDKIRLEQLEKNKSGIN